jgi:uncharacterized protein (DUF927 family)
LNNQAHNYIFVKLSEYKKALGKTSKQIGGLGRTVIEDKVDNVDKDDKFIIRIYQVTDQNNNSVNKYEIVPITFTDDDKKKDFVNMYLREVKSKGTGEDQSEKTVSIHLLQKLEELCNEITNTTLPETPSRINPATLDLRPMPPVKTGV